MLQLLPERPCLFLARTERLFCGSQLRVRSGMLLDLLVQLRPELCLGRVCCLFEFLDGLLVLLHRFRLFLRLLFQNGDLLAELFFLLCELFCLLFELLGGFFSLSFSVRGGGLQGADLLVESARLLLLGHELLLQFEDLELAGLCLLFCRLLLLIQLFLQLVEFFLFFLGELLSF